MAVLGHAHWEVIPDEMHQLLEFISRQACVRRFYLADGTGLALQIGHRRSVDLDFFSEEDQVLWDTRQEIIQVFLYLRQKSWQKNGSWVNDEKIMINSEKMDFGENAMCERPKGREKNEQKIKADGYELRQHRKNIES